MVQHVQIERLKSPALYLQTSVEWLVELQAMFTQSLNICHALFYVTAFSIQPCFSNVWFTDHFFSEWKVSNLWTETPHGQLFPFLVTNPSPNVWISNREEYIRLIHLYSKIESYLSKWFHLRFKSLKVAAFRWIWSSLCLVFSPNPWVFRTLVRRGQGDRLSLHAAQSGLRIHHLTVVFLAVIGFCLEGFLGSYLYIIIYIYVNMCI